jgi:allophanate hydrolase
MSTRVEEGLSRQFASSVAAVQIAVVGAHLSGQPLNHQLTSRGGVLVATTETAPCYRLLALPTDPPKPGLLRVAEGTLGAGAVEVEVWDLEPAAFASFVDEIPSPLCIGRIMLSDDSDVAGFLCEPFAVPDAPDITSYGGWRAYRAATPR